MRPLMSLIAFGVIGIAAFAAPSLAALKVDSKAPDFTAPAYLAGKPFTFKLSDALKKGTGGRVLLPLRRTRPAATWKRTCSPRRSTSSRPAHATVIGVTAGNTSELADFSKETEHCGGKFAVAADDGAKIAKQYDAILAQKPEWSDRTSYVIAPSGSIAHVYSDLNPSKHVKETLDAVKALEAHH
jgi:peroxiredoxin